MKIQLSKVLKQVKNSEYIDDPASEKFVTVSGQGKGVKERIIKDGKTPVPFNAYRIKKGQLIYSRIGASDGAFGIVPDELDNAVVSKDFPVFDVNQDIANIDYIVCYLTSDLFCRKAKSESFGATMTRFKEDKLLSTVMELPKLEEQALVISKLRKVRLIIEHRQEELNNLDNLVKARFVEMFGEPRNNKKYGFVPFDDVVEYMGDIGSNGANKVVVEHLDMKDEEDYALMVRFLNFTKNDFTEDVKFISKESYDFFKKSQLHGGELIICKIGSAGLNYVMPDLKRPVSLGLNQIMVRINEKIIMPYLYQYLHTDYGEYLISGCINGAVTKSITKTKLKKIPIMLPSIDEQKAYADFVEKVDKSKVAIQKSLDETQILFDSLMQKYFG